MLKKELVRRRSSRMFALKFHFRDNLPGDLENITCLVFTEAGLLECCTMLMEDSLRNRSWREYENASVQEKEDRLTG